MLRVGNLERSIKFYTEIMGMTLLRQSVNESQNYSLAFVGYGSNPEHAEIEDDDDEDDREDCPENFGDRLPDIPHRAAAPARVCRVDRLLGHGER